MSTYTKPKLREYLKDLIMDGDKGGKPGQWSARKAQLLAKEYEKAGGGYTGPKTAAQKSLSKWTKEEWGTMSGKNSIQGDEATGERYLPAKARKALTKREYEVTTSAKRLGIMLGKQFVAQPESIAKKTALYRR
jgi:allophanate hydrolase subunit 2